MTLMPFIRNKPPPVRSFELGIIVIDPVAEAMFSRRTLVTALLRHGVCKWGFISTALAEINDSALLSGGPVVSVHRLDRGIELSIITQGDRNSTFMILDVDRISIRV